MATYMSLKSFLILQEFESKNLSLNIMLNIIYKSLSFENFGEHLGFLEDVIYEDEPFK